MKIEFPKGTTGIHPPTSTLARILKINHVLNPFNEQPYSEALLFGIGGGLDTGVILFKFPHLVHPILMLGFRYQWNDTKSFLQNLMARLMISASFDEFEDEKKAEAALQHALKHNKQPIVWVDRAFLPHHNLPHSLRGYFNYQVGVHARDGRLWRLYLDDLSTKPIEIREKVFTSARASLCQNNFLMMTFNYADTMASQQLRDAVIQGIKDCSTHLTRPLKTVGISNLQNWASSLQDRHSPTGWPFVFKDRKGLYSTLRTVYESIKLNGSDGFALRKIYADFLNEASLILRNPGLNAIAGQYLQLANHWASLAENALPSSVSKFDKIKSLLNAKYEAYRKLDQEKIQRSIKDLETLEEQIEERFPMNISETSQLFDRLSSRINLIAELERSAALRLRDIAH